MRRGRQRVDDGGRSGRPKEVTTDENVNVMHTLVMRYSRRDLPSIASEVGISFGTEQSILTDMLVCQRFRQDGCREC